MKNVAAVFFRDLKRIAKAPAAWAVLLFLLVLPSLYTWFNVAAFWSPYENTQSLRVCVVNEDQGATDDVFGSLHIGDDVVEQLKGNDQLGWQFVSREEAYEQVASGEAYAAFIIPATFSSDVASIATGDFERPTLEYVVNEKPAPSCRRSPIPGQRASTRRPTKSSSLP